MGLKTNAEERAGRHPWIDAMRRPLYVMTYPAQRTTDDVYRAHDAAEAIYRTTEGMLAWVIDAAMVTDATARERAIVGAYEIRVGPAAEQRCAGVGLVIPNAVARGVYTAIRWLSPARYPAQIFQTKQQALAWTAAQLSARASSVRAQSR